MSLLLVSNRRMSAARAENKQNWDARMKPKQIMSGGIKTKVCGATESGRADPDLACPADAHVRLSQNVPKVRGGETLMQNAVFHQGPTEEGVKNASYIFMPVELPGWIGQSGNASN
jgi:hypothetical protein